MSQTFWGLNVCPGNKYERTVDRSFRLSGASLTPVRKGNGATTLCVSVNDEKYALCTLIPSKIEQHSLDLVFSAGDVVAFEVEGDLAIDIVGNYLADYDSEEFDSDYDEELDDIMEEDEDSEDFIEDSEDEAPKIEELGSDEESLDSEEAELETPSKAKKAAAPVPESKKAQKKRKLEEAKAKAAEQAEHKEKKSKLKEAPKETPKEKKQKETPKETSKKALHSETLKGGIMIEDRKIGTGDVARKGQKIGMYYIGKLKNGKQFDSCTKGRPFSFVLGKGEVIKGWDLGLAGMKKGGERRLIIPAAMAYGKSGSPPEIPPNSELTFDVRMVDIK